MRGRDREGGSFGGRAPKRRTPLTIEGELVAKSTGTVSDFSVGDRVFHQKFGNGNVVAVDGNKLTIAFDKAGEKRVVDSFVERVSSSKIQNSELLSLPNIMKLSHWEPDLRTLTRTGKNSSPFSSSARACALLLRKLEAPR